MRLVCAAVLCLAPVPAIAQEAPQPCGPTGTVEARISKQYGESLVGAGIVPGGVLFTTANPETGTFTIMLRRPDGVTCVMMGGTGYAFQEPKKPGVDL
jgi:ABC-type enterobactin transport system permease subunit